MPEFSSKKKIAFTFQNLTAPTYIHVRIKREKNNQVHYGYGGGNLGPEVINKGVEI